MSSHALHARWRVALACAATFTLSACQREAAPVQPDVSELAWARAALDRNPQIEVIASDEQARVFTIKDMASGEVQIVRLNDVAAAPLAQFTAATPAAHAADESLAPAEVIASRTATAPQPTPAAPDAADADAETPTAAPAAQSDFTIERTDGRVQVTGPGVSIVSTGSPSELSGAVARERRAAEPIICEGRRMLRLDDRDIYVEGDAVTAREGCEIFITNSRITASGVAVIVRNAIVHVSNSHIEGAAGSFDANAEAKMYVRNSTFRGVSRRDELALIQDQGGNRWR